MNEFPIDKNVPIPPLRCGRRFPFADMEVGDSFFVPVKGTGLVSGSVSWAKKRLGWKFVTRTVDGGVRIWRVG